MAKQSGFQSYNRRFTMDLLKIHFTLTRHSSGTFSLLPLCACLPPSNSKYKHSLRFFLSLGPTTLFHPLFLGHSTLSRFPPGLSPILTLDKLTISKNECPQCKNKMETPFEFSLSPSHWVSDILTSV